MSRMIPPAINPSVKSNAEKKIFDVIRDAAGSERWVGLHSLGLARHQTKRRGEVDFVLVMPQGVVVLEVKGGRVTRESGQWVFTDRYGKRHSKSESPFDQASSAMFSLGEDLRKRFHGTPIEDVLLGYGVLFPDIEFDSIGSESDPALVYDLRDRERPFAEYVDRLIAFTRSRQQQLRRGLNGDQIDDVVDFLRGNLDLIPHANVVIDYTRDQLAELTREQRIVLDACDEREPRVIIEGPAGSGKTMLAMETARRDARKGLRVLFLCFNKKLATLTRAVLEDEEYEGELVVRTVHSHFHNLVEKSSLSDDFRRQAADLPESEVFSTLYPEYATLAAMEGVEQPYDSLVVDEAQDVLSGRYIDALLEGLRGGLSNGRWRLFLDANGQACIYGGLDRTEFDRLKGVAHTRTLTFNCRNTKQIALQTNVVAAPEIKGNGRVDGPPVEFFTYVHRRELSGKLEKILNDLRHDDVAPGGVTILFPQRPDADVERMLATMGVTELGYERVAMLGSPELEQATWSVVSGFKGLENDVIVLVGIDDIESNWCKAVTYVGMSRARARLYVILHADCDAVRCERFSQELERQAVGEGDIVA